MADLNIVLCGVLGESEHLIKEQNIASPWVKCIYVYDLSEWILTNVTLINF